MNLDITKRRTEDNGDHPPIPHADEQEKELQVIVSPPAYPPKPILKTLVPDTTVNRSPTRAPAPTNKIRASMTLPSSPQSPELPTKQRSLQTETTTTAVRDAKKPGDSPVNPITQNSPASPQHKKQDGSKGPCLTSLTTMHSSIPRRITNPKTTNRTRAICCYIWT